MQDSFGENCVLGRDEEAGLEGGRVPVGWLVPEVLDVAPHGASLSHICNEAGLVPDDVVVLALLCSYVLIPRNTNFIKIFL